MYKFSVANIKKNLLEYYYLNILCKLFDNDYPLLKAAPSCLSPTFALQNFSKIDNWLKAYYSPFDCENRILDKELYRQPQLLEEIVEILNNFFLCREVKGPKTIRISDLDAVSSSKSQNPQFRNYKTYNNLVHFGEYCFTKYLDKTIYVKEGALPPYDALIYRFNEYREKPYSVTWQRWCDRLVLNNNGRSHRHAAMAYRDKIGDKNFQNSYSVKMTEEIFSQEAFNEFISLGECFTIIADKEVHNEIKAFLIVHRVLNYSFELLPSRYREDDKKCFAYFFYTGEAFSKRIKCSHEHIEYARTRNLELVLNYFRELVKLGFSDSFENSFSKILQSFAKTVEGTPTEEFPPVG